MPGMAKENKKTKELVRSEDDPTAELETLALRHSSTIDDSPPEVLADTHNVDGSGTRREKEDERSETINRLQYDIAQFRARWNGLEAEIEARRQITENLQQQITQLEGKLDRKDQSLQKRAASIKSLKAEIRKRNSAYDDLQLRLGEREAENQQLLSDRENSLEKHSGELAATAAQIRDLQDMVSRTEAYADTVRRQLQDQDDTVTALDRRCVELDRDLGESNARIGQLETELAESLATGSSLQSELDNAQSVHDEELSSIRSDLAKAQEAINEQKRIAEDLTSELEESRNRSTELEADLSQARTDTEDLRRRLDEQENTVAELDRATGDLETKLEEAAAQIAALKSELSDVEAARDDLQNKLDTAHTTHAEEIRTIRFELSEAQETVAQQELVAEELASDLMDTRNHRVELEQSLSRAEQSSLERIEKLESENRRLLEEIEDRDRKLAVRSDAIDSLLAELAGKARQIDSIVEVHQVIDDVDSLVSRGPEDRPAQDRDRITRLLVGTVKGQELRFPLFKDRLTIGRTDQNDIQIKASYVSRRHAVVVTDRGTTRVIDWGSKNGVFVNGERITEHFLEHGDTVTIGTADFRYEELPKRDS